jgi:type I restriction enzyme S subunit
VGQAKVRRAQGGAARDNLDLFQVRELPVPEVAAELQRHIGDRVRQAERLRDQAAAARGGIERLLRAVVPGGYRLGVERPAYWVDAADLGDRLDAGLYQPRYRELVRRLQRKQTRRLREVCTFCPPLAGRTDLTAAQGYIEIGDVDIAQGTLAGHTDLARSPLPDGPKHVLRRHDLLVSRVRPNRGAVALVPGACQGALATAGFARLRPRRGVSPFWLWAVLRQPFTAWQLEQFAAGATYPTVEEEYLGEVVLPWPDEALQARVADLARQACRLPYQARDVTAAARLAIAELAD